MAIISCPECNNECSSFAESCPKCGFPLKKSNETISYETKLVKIRCWGRGQKSINAKLEKYTSAGWEVISMLKDSWLSGLLSPVYQVTLRRPKKVTSSTVISSTNSSKRKTCPHCGDIVTSSVCGMCGKKNNLF